MRRHRNRHFFAAWKFVLTIGFLLAAPALAQKELDAPAFSVGPSDLLRIASTSPAGPGADVVVLLQEDRIVYDEARRATRTHRVLAKILTKDGAEAWSTTQARWEVWHQERPVLKARVVTADGRLHQLDPATIAEAPADPDGPGVFSDVRILQAPLPAVAPGSIAEEESITRDTAPFYERGDVSMAPFYFGTGSPRAQTRLILEVPASLPLRYKAVHLRDPNPKREESAGRVRLVFESGPLDKTIEFEPWTPPDVRAVPQVIFSSGESWADVAQHYSGIIDRQLKGAELSPYLADGTGSGTVQERASGLLARLRKEIRYAAVELGEAAIIPRAPKEVIERRYGDCKDQATLMVGLLRASGVPAYVALTNAVRSQDPDPDLPGMGAFDHAIVYVPGPPALWIDPTDLQSEAGELPVEEQGRLALVAAPETTALLRTPETSSASNRQVQTREFYLAESGPARVVETTESWGTRAWFLRTLTDIDPGKLKEQLANYVENAYAAKDVSRVVQPPPGFALPAKFVLETQKSQHGFTSLVEAVVYIRPESALSALPAYFHSAEENGAKKARKRELLLPESFTNEIHYRIIPPPGYVLGELPRQQSRTVGTATFSQEYRNEPDGSVTAILCFDTGPRRMAPEAVDALRAAVIELDESEAVRISFEQKGMALLEAGRVREALAELRALAELHPKEALHHGQIARALLAAGLGEAAREEARSAVEIEPNSAAAHATLGFVLQHDLLGRFRRVGFDHAGAEAQYRKALELDPENSDTRADLAILLEHNSKGIRYGDGARLDEAIAEYRSIAKHIKGTNLDANLPIALIWGRRFREAAEAAKDLPVSSGNRGALLLTAVAAADGPTVAIREASLLGLDTPARQQALENAGNLLIGLRLYAQSGALLAAAAQGSQNAAGLLARANLIGKLKHYEDTLLPPDDPRSVAQKMLMIPFLDEARVQGEMALIISKHGKPKLLQPDEIERARKTARGIRASVAKLGMPPDVALDLMIGNLRFTVDGDRAAGFRVQAQIFGSTRNLVLFVIWEGGQYRILDDDENPDVAGREIRERAAAGDVAGARRILDWLREAQPAVGGDDPLAGPLLSRFWTKRSDAGKDSILLAAAVLLAAERDDAAAIPFLKSALERADSEQSRADLLLALTRGLLGRQQPVEAEALAERLLLMYPASETAFRLYTTALRSQQRWEESRRTAEERLQRVPDDPDAIRELHRCAFAKGNYEEAERQLRRLVTLGKVTAHDWNEIGWDALFHPPVSEQMLQETQQGIGPNADFDDLHTLAMLYAELGKTTEARDVLWQAMEVAGLDVPDSPVWLVVGRMAENFGARAAALAAYKKVEKPGREEQMPGSNYVLAQRRLAALAR